MQVKLLNHTSLSVCAEAIRTCWNSFKDDNIYATPIDEIFDEDKELMKRVINRYKHESTMEHLVYSFSINGISRAVLQELSRHRMQSLSVKSTRYTLNELKNDNGFLNVSEYCVLTGNTIVDKASHDAIINLRNILQSGVKNDIAKYCLPESFKTNVRMTINARSLKNFLYLRSSKAALWEIRELANNIYEQLPDSHKFLFEECIEEL